MSGEKNIEQLIKNMTPKLNEGEYVFCTVNNISKIETDKIVCFFKEEEGYAIVVNKLIADSWGLSYQYIAAWITLTVHSSLEAVGLTAAFSTALANNNISCNVIAGFYHDHIFVDVKDAERAIEALQDLASH